MKFTIGLVSAFVLVSFFSTTSVLAKAGRKTSSAELNCNSSSDALRQQLVQFSLKDPFIGAILKAETKRLPKNFQCDSISSWELKKDSEGFLMASATTTCLGLEHHVNLDFSGRVQTNKDGTACEVWITSFVERVGE